MRKSLILLSVLLLFAGCSFQLPEAGIPQSLAIQRHEMIHDVRYELSFDIPADKTAAISAAETVRFRLDAGRTVVMDFNTASGCIHSLRINGKEVEIQTGNGYLVLPSKHLLRGENTVEMDFVAGEQSLNRRDDFLYTLLVPDRARTLFPCFDQPDIKSVYTLTLTVPDSWVAVSNTSAASEYADAGRKTVIFNPTEPLSTYLFSFVAGVFHQETAVRNGRSISMYHRENDPVKTAQIPEVMGLVFDSLEYMEEYTGLEYPFAKYDFIVIPDFQYGGMEHTGATLYRDRSIFLGARPTTDELLNRTSLIAHETAHMWFGDCVTMKWFNDVWTKEVFANWFAARIARPAFPDVNYQVMDLKKYYAPSYSEDRTLGSNAIQRELPKLSDAGLIYCNIIYDKSPVVMEMLARTIGYDSFREGLREYVSTYKYGNASWDDLIAILDRHTDVDVSQWSNVWIKEKGMPVYTCGVEDGKAVMIQSDPFNAGNVWPQDVASVVEDGVCVPNTDGLAYGAFLVDGQAARHMMDKYLDYDVTRRMSVLMTLYENAWRGVIDPVQFEEWCVEMIPQEMEPLILSSMLEYATEVAEWHTGDSSRLEETLFAILSCQDRHHEQRLLAFRRLADFASTKYANDLLYSIWEQQNPPQGLILGENDYTSLSYHLMMYYPELAENIAGTQRARISNHDRLETFDYVCRATSPDGECRQKLFQEMLASGENRRPEPRVLTALRYLCHKISPDEAVTYVIPCLEVLPEIQRTGDIFFPASWCRTALGSQRSAAAGQQVYDYLESHPEFPGLLKTKVLQAIDTPATSFRDCL